ncbi:MAG: hypothetical protein KF791_06985 [Verrucomicrobiae bacterium]|nr:hypothetical protein [Verrucomicrobiae bacterium]
MSIFEPVTLRGILDSVLVHPGEVFRLAVVYRAHAVVVAHNHQLVNRTDPPPLPPTERSSGSATPAFRDSPKAAPAPGQSLPRHSARSCAGPRR